MNLDFDMNTHCLALDSMLSALSNPIRRQIIYLLKENRKMQLMEMTRTLNIDDHTKVVFHLKILKGSGLVHKDDGKSYFLTTAGEKTFNCLEIFKSALLALDA